MVKKIRSILIANRAEIAVRVINTCKDLGIKSISIYSDDDSELPHAKLSDIAISLGSGELSDTYLNVEKIIDIAKKYNIDAIHPGYGFLSENSIFCEAVEKAGIIFIGPESPSIKLMGDKIASKNKAQSSKIPVVPGYNGDSQEDGVLKSEAKKIGFPLMIKASAGGGGKGMRVVSSLEEFDESLRAARSEALKSFSNDKVLLEKYIETSKHLEVQVVGDGEGKAIHLFERECSMQRRHQKVIEESPSLSIDKKIRENLCASAVQLAESISYRGAGTVEFIYDVKTREFYFLEMNTRLQVEHPVTEMITGVDLVALQIKVAQDSDIGISQEDIKMQGHAIECRIYAEDPYNNFFPQSGKIRFIGNQKSDARLDCGFFEANDVGTNYDPMLAKLIVHGSDRTQAIEKMIKALDEHPFLGITNNRDFLIEVIKCDAFISSDYSTNFLEKNLDFFVKDRDLNSVDPLVMASYGYLIQDKGNDNAWSNLSGSIG